MARTKNKAGLLFAVAAWTLGLLLPTLAMPSQTAFSNDADSGYSPLGEITAANVHQLTLAFRFGTGAADAHGNAPVSAGDSLLILTPFPHTLYALDLTQAAATVKWTYRPTPGEMAAGRSCCGAATGGITTAGDRVYLSTFDGHLVALTLDSGKVLWDRTVAQPQTGETLGTPPLALATTVIVGTSGDDAGARGSLVALDSATGNPLWKVFSTGSDQDAGIGTSFNPFYPGDRDVDLGIRTWPPAAWTHGGGGLASPLLFDAASNSIYQATGHPAPWNPDQRDGDNRWTSGIFARDAETGQAQWFDPINPHDLYALGASGGLLLVEDGTNQILVHPDANGYVYTLDPGSGEILSAHPYLPITVADGVDLKTGKLRRRADHVPRPHTTVRDICPAWPAGSNALPAFSPETKLLYIPASPVCMDMEAVPTSYIAGTQFTGGNVRMKLAAGSSPGALIAWDIAGGRPVWTDDEPLPLRGGALVTQGGIVFYGTLDDKFKAVDARTGHLLWQFDTGSGIVSRPVTYRGPDGRQYIAVLAGSGGLTGHRSAQEIDARDTTAAHGLAGLLGAVPPPADSGGMLYVFKLP
jgi:lanthanide-dependent methanol dehydrogenase